MFTFHNITRTRYGQRDTIYNHDTRQTALMRMHKAKTNNKHKAKRRMWTILSYASFILLFRILFTVMHALVFALRMHYWALLFERTVRPHLFSIVLWCAVAVLVQHYILEITQKIIIRKATKIERYSLALDRKCRSVGRDRWSLLPVFHALRIVSSVTFVFIVHSLCFIDAWCNLQFSVSVPLVMSPNTDLLIINRSSKLFV